MNAAEQIRSNLDQTWALFAQSVPQGASFAQPGVSCYKTALPTPFFNTATQFNPQSKQEILEDLSHVHTFFESGEAAPYCIYQESSPLDSDIQEVMTKQQFLAFGEVKGMHRKLLTKLPTPKLHAESRIHEVRSHLDLDAWSRPVAEAFHMDEPSRHGLVDIMFTSLNNPSFIHSYIVENGRPVSNATLFIHNQTASLYNCGTIESARRKGYMSALIAHMINIAIDRGCTDMVLQSSPASASIFEKFGFESSVSYNVYVKAA